MSDSGPKPWTIRGVSEEARKTAIEAAARAGLDLGPWVSHAIRQTAQSDRGGVVGEVVSDGVSDTARVQLIAALFTGLSQIAGARGCSGTALRARRLLDQHMDALAREPLPRPHHSRQPPRPGRRLLGPGAEQHAISRSAVAAGLDRGEGAGEPEQPAHAHLEGHGR